MNFDDVSPKTFKFNIHFYWNNKGESNFTSTFEEIQNECTNFAYDTLLWI